MDFSVDAPRKVARPFFADALACAAQRKILDAPIDSQQYAQRWLIDVGGAASALDNLAALGRLPSRRAGGRRRGIDTMRSLVRSELTQKRPAEPPSAGRSIAP